MIEFEGRLRGIDVYRVKVVWIGLRDDGGTCLASMCLCLLFVEAKLLVYGCLGIHPSFVTITSWEPNA